MSTTLNQILTDLPKEDRCGLYLIHFTDKHHHTQHYLGSSVDVKRRFAQHCRGQGAKITSAVVEAGIGMILARFWHFPGCNNGELWEEEKRLKARKNHKYFCPICREEHHV